MFDIQSIKWIESCLYDILCVTNTTEKSSRTHYLPSQTQQIHTQPDKRPCMIFTCCHLPIWNASSFVLLNCVISYSKWYIPWVCGGVCVLCMYSVFRRMSHSLPDTRCSCRRLHPCQYTEIVNTLAFARSICVYSCACVRVFCVAEFPLFISSHWHMAHACHHRGCLGWGYGEWKKKVRWRMRGNCAWKELSW